MSSPFCTRPRAGFDRLDPPREVLLIVLEGRARLGRDQLALAGADARQRQQAAQVGLLHHVRDRAEHHHQVGDVDERGEAGHRLVGAARLQLELGAGVAEGRGPGVELVHAALAQRLRRLEAQQRVHLAQRVGDRRARGLDQRAAGPLAVEVARLHEQVPGALRAVRIDALQVHLVGGEAELAEFLRLVDDDLVDADLFQRHHVVAPALQRRQLLGQLLLHRLEALAGDAVAVVGAQRDGLAGCDLLLDHRALEGGRHRNEAERRMGDDHRVPVRRRRARQEPRALLLHEVGFVGDQDAGGRIELQEFARDLRQAVAGHDQHRLVDQAEPLLLHDRAGDGVGFAGADGVRDVGRAGGDDAPDHPLLVLVEADDAAGAGQGQMPSVEMARHEIVEAVVVDPGQPVGAVGIGPDPGGERVLDPRQLLLGGLGRLAVEDALLDAVLDDGVEDLRRGAVQRVVQQPAGVAPRRAPFGGAGGGARERRGLHRPGGDLDGVPHPCCRCPSPRRRRPRYRRPESRARRDAR